MQNFVARANIERFRRLIAQQPDGPDRDCLERMLAEELAKLRAYRTNPDSIGSQERASDETNSQRL